MYRYIIKGLFFFCLFIFITFSLYSCAPSYTQHGHLVDSSEYEHIIKNSDTKETVIRKLGSPSSKDPLDENTWLYITSIHEKKPFKPSKKIKQKVLAISFDENNTLVSRRLYSIEDGRTISPLEEKTVTYGRKTSLFREIFGNLGKYQPSPN